MRSKLDVQTSQTYTLSSITTHAHFKTPSSLAVSPAASPSTTDVASDSILILISVRSHNGADAKHEAHETGCCAYLTSRRHASNLHHAVHHDAAAAEARSHRRRERDAADRHHRILMMVLCLLYLLDSIVLQQSQSKNSHTATLYCLCLPRKDHTHVIHTTSSPPAHPHTQHHTQHITEPLCLVGVSTRERLP